MRMSTRMGNICIVVIIIIIINVIISCVIVTFAALRLVDVDDELLL
jgi:hypothetical protein